MELKYCVDHAIPHSKFLSWSEEDQDKIIEYLVFDGKRCARCGSVPDEWLDDVTKRPVEPPPYVVDSVKCLGCAELDHMQEYIGKGPKPGLYFHLTPWHERRELEDEEDG